jgi:hypothetical protein
MEMALLKFIERPFPLTRANVEGQSISCVKSDEALLMKCKSAGCLYLSIRTQGCQLT